MTTGSTAGEEGLRRQAAAAFQRHFGEAPARVASAPGRIDRVSVVKLPPEDVLDAAFELTDSHDGVDGEGDHYYVRVRQIDGGSAWSSPIWIGGYRPK